MKLTVIKVKYKIIIRILLLVASSADDDVSKVTVQKKVVKMNNPIVIK